VLFLQPEHFLYIVGELALRHRHLRVGMVFLVAEIGRMIRDADHIQPLFDGGSDIILDRPFCMAAAFMMGMKVEFHVLLLQGYSLPRNSVSGMHFRSFSSCCIAVLIYLPALYTTPTGCLISSSCTRTVRSVPCLISFAADRLEMIEAPRFNSTIRFTSSLLDTSMTIFGCRLNRLNT